MQGPLTLEGEYYFLGSMKTNFLFVDVSVNSTLPVRIVDS